MSSYFDEAQREVREDFSSVAAVEARVKRDVELVAGDVDIPGGTREVLIGTIALLEYETSYQGPPTKGHEQSNIMRQSALIEALHSQFHSIASCQIQTRFGVLNDNPRNILTMREAYDRERCDARKDERTDEPREQITAKEGYLRDQLANLELEFDEKHREISTVRARAEVSSLARRLSSLSDQIANTKERLQDVETVLAQVKKGIWA